jgi:hypothetical protein
LNSTPVLDDERSIEERAQRARGSVLAFLLIAAAAVGIPLAVVLFLLF